jgi:hypothetical protein
MENLPKKIEKLPLHLFEEEDSVSDSELSSEETPSEYSDISSEVEYITKYIDPPKIEMSTISTQCEPTIDGFHEEETEEEVHSVIEREPEAPEAKPEVKIVVNLHDIARRFQIAWWYYKLRSRMRRITQRKEILFRIMKHIQDANGRNRIFKVELWKYWKVKAEEDICCKIAELYRQYRDEVAYFKLKVAEEIARNKKRMIKQ